MGPAYRGFAFEPNELRYLHYDNVGILFERPLFADFMPPSIDTILLSRGIACVCREGLVAHRIIDVGSGSGFIGKFAAAKVGGDGDLSVVLCDVDRSAKTYCSSPKFNQLVEGVGGRRVSWQVVVENAVTYLSRDSQFDLIVSNPPYVPSPSEVLKDSPANDGTSFWEGTGLLVSLVENLLDKRFNTNAHLILALTSSTFKSKGVVRVLEEAEKVGVRVRIVQEQEIAYKAWFAGSGAMSHLLATPDEVHTRRRIGSNHYFVGMTPAFKSRLPGEGRECGGYHWHVSYILDVYWP